VAARVRCVNALHGTAVRVATRGPPRVRSKIQQSPGLSNIGAGEGNRTLSFVGLRESLVPERRPARFESSLPDHFI
jgi:hypothetical protein